MRLAAEMSFDFDVWIKRGELGDGGFGFLLADHLAVKERHAVIVFQPDAFAESFQRVHDRISGDNEFPVMRDDQADDAYNITNKIMEYLNKQYSGAK